MSREEFFDNLKNELAKADSTKACKEEQRKSAVKSALSQIKPTVLAYKKEIESLGVTVRAHGLDDDDGPFIEFKMIYNDGGHHGIQIRNGRLRSCYTDDIDGRNYSSEIPDSDLAVLDVDKFEAQLKKAINEFFLFADRHRGYK